MNSEKHKEVIYVSAGRLARGHFLLHPSIASSPELGHGVQVMILAILSISISAPSYSGRRHPIQNQIAAAQEKEWNVSECRVALTVVRTDFSSCR
jgi:hypothetical protein